MHSEKVGSRGLVHVMVTQGLLTAPAKLIMVLTWRHLGCQYCLPSILVMGLTHPNVCNCSSQGAAAGSLLPEELARRARQRELRVRARFFQCSGVAKTFCSLWSPLELKLCCSHAQTICGA